MARAISASAPSNSAATASRPRPSANLPSLTNAFPSSSFRSATARAASRCACASNCPVILCRRTNAAATTRTIASDRAARTETRGAAVEQPCRPRGWTRMGMQAITPPGARKQSVESPISISSPWRSRRLRRHRPLTRVPLPDSRSTRTKASPFFSTARCSREMEMSGMTMAFVAARPRVVKGSTMRNSAPLCGPAVTRSRAVAGLRSPPDRTVASARGAFRDEHAARAAASTSGDGPPGSVGSLPRPISGPGRWAKTGIRIGFTVSLDTLSGRLGKQIDPRLSVATTGVVAGCMTNRAPMPPDNTATATSPARAGRETAPQQRAGDFFPAAEMQNSKVIGPTPIRSPSRSRAGAPTTVPFNSTPFTDARSSKTHAAPCRSMRAWVRETPASFNTRSLEPARPMLTDSPSNRNFRPRPLPAAMVRAKATSKTPSKEDLVSDGPEEHEEERRKDEQYERQQQLHGRFVGEPLRPLRALVPHLRGQDPQDVSERRAELVSMHERLHERRERRQIHAACEIAQRLFSRLAEQQLANRDAQLFAQRTLAAFLHNLGQGAGEVEPGLDAEGEQIDGIRQRAHERALPGPHAVAQPDQGIRRAADQAEEPGPKAQAQTKRERGGSGEEQQRRDLHQSDYLGGRELQRPARLSQPAIDPREGQRRYPARVRLGDRQDRRRTQRREEASRSADPELDRGRWRPHRDTAVQRTCGEECRGGERGREQRGGNLEDIGGHVDHMSTATMRRMATKPAACRTTTAPTSRYP